MLERQLERIGGSGYLPGLETSNDQPCNYSALVVVDADAKIKFSFWDGEAGQSAKTILCEDYGLCLRAWLEILVRDLIANAQPLELTSYVVFRQGGMTLRLLPLAGSEHNLFGLVMEADLDSATIARAAARYQLTRRQTEVLLLVLGGASASDVARSLIISEYTAQGYVKSLLAKTASRNRAEMVAKVLNWKRPAAADNKATTVKRASNN